MGAVILLVMLGAPAAHIYTYTPEVIIVLAAIKEFPKGLMHP